MPLPVKVPAAFKVEPENESPVPRVTDCKFLLASLITKLLTVRVAMLTLPTADIVNRLDPEDDATWNGLFMPVPCTQKLIADDVALTPATEPLSINIELPIADGEVHTANFPV